MNYVKDLSDMLENKFIKESEFMGLDNHDDKIEFDIKRLYNNLQTIPEHNLEIAKVILGYMTEFNIYKKAIEMKVRINKIPDPKEPSRIYLQARGAVAISKGNRVWYGVYMGKAEEWENRQDKLIRKGRYLVMKKVIETIKFKMGL